MSHLPRSPARFALAAILAALPGCTASGCSSGTSPNPTDPQALPVSDLAEVLYSPRQEKIDQWTARYYDGYLTELLRGDTDQARTSYESVIAEAGGAAPQLAARAALRLAELEALAGRRRQAIELMARAAVLGRTNPDIVEQADRLHARLGSLRAAASEVRGPPMGTELDGVSDATRERFARAEALLAAYHEIRLRPRLEQLHAGVRTKESAMDAAVRAYRQITALDGPAAQTAAEFRVASLYHDLALSLMFDLPPELEPRAASRLQRSLRASAIGHLDRARAAYRRALEHGEKSDGPADDPGIARWSAPAARGLRSVDDLLGGED